MSPECFRSKARKKSSQSRSREIAAMGDEGYELLSFCLETSFQIRTILIATQCLGIGVFETVCWCGAVVQEFGRWMQGTWFSGTCIT